MRIPARNPTNIVLVFVSSGDDLAALRDLVWRLGMESINPVLREMKRSVRLDVDRWEHTPPHRVPEGQTLNSEFVTRARAAQLVVCLLHEKIGEGTREEIEAALDDDDVELSVVWCVTRDDWPNTEVGQFLAPLKDEIFIDRAGLSGTDGPAVAIARILFQATLTADAQTPAGDDVRLAPSPASASEGLLREQR